MFHSKWSELSKKTKHPEPKIASYSQEKFLLSADQIYIFSILQLILTRGHYQFLILSMIIYFHTKYIFSLINSFPNHSHIIGNKCLT